jgi:alkylated DNA repair protein alkB family protein 8
MIEAFHTLNPRQEKEGRKRISQHFGHHFDYNTFGASTHFNPIPTYITDFLPRLPIQSYLPDQFTVQYYPPGSGIPPHVDTHSMFAEALYSLSFGNAVPMQFRMSGPNDARKMRLPKRSAQAENTESVPAPAPEDAGQKADEEQPPGWELLLPARSLLLMTGPSRYGYTHAIRPRKTDVIEGETVQRQGRYSITMRTVRRGDEIGCDCAYPGVCDARIREEMAARDDGGP